MQRFVTASLEDLELLFVDTKDGDTDVAEATYPPGCDPPQGPVRFRPLSVGGLKVEVERRRLHADDFRLGVLFHAGSCVFTDAADLARFFRGPVADAFGLAAEPLPDKPAEELLEDLRPGSTPPRPQGAPRSAGRSATRPPRPTSQAGWGRSCTGRTMPSGGSRTWSLRSSRRARRPARRRCS